MLKQLKKRTQGFTIIEVMIVLAIAGLILLIVFLAVPALQRNSRNTQRNSDAATVLGVINEYINNNNGSLPTAVCLSGNVVTISGGTCASPTNPTTANIGGQFSAVTLTAYAAAFTPAANTLAIETASTCSGSTHASGTPRSFIAYFYNEPGSPGVLQCKSS